jgi:hypothetical protein
LPTPTENDVWYSRQPLGKNKLGIIMKTMVLTAELYGRKVNHSTRKTFATTLRQSDRPITEVAQLGGLRSEIRQNNIDSCSVK